MNYNLKNPKSLIILLLSILPILIAGMVWMINFDLVIGSSLLKVLAVGVGVATFLILRPIVKEEFTEIKGMISFAVFSLSSMFVYYLLLLFTLSVMPANDILDTNNSISFKTSEGLTCRHINFNKPDLLFCSIDEKVTDDFFDIHHFTISGLDVYTLDSKINGELVSDSKYRKFCKYCVLPFGFQYMIETRGFDLLYLFYLYLMNIFLFPLLKIFLFQISFLLG